MKLFKKDTLDRFPIESWEFKAFKQFKETMVSEENLFPCTFGVAGFNADQLRYCFIENEPENRNSANLVAAALQSYLPIARNSGKNTSLVVIFNESKDLGLDKYESIFWELLNRVHRLDSREWPLDISVLPDSKYFEFSFGGEAIFVVCNTPSHTKRKSRYSSFFTITFQPRWVFDNVIGKNVPNSDRNKATIRKRLSNFDQIPPSQELGAFGDDHNREWKQYFLHDNNDKKNNKCPFIHTSICNQVIIDKTKKTHLPLLINELLPPTGSVELQKDTPFRHHPQHGHKTDETLHIVEGSITFYVGENEYFCQPGDRLLLPAHTKHSSTAGEQGCLYFIATRLISNTDQNYHRLEVTNA